MQWSNNYEKEVGTKGNTFDLYLEVATFVYQP
jgi:hypothetical protein